MRLETIHKLAADAGLTPQIEAHLVSLYGSRLSAILDFVHKDNRLGQPLAAGSRDILAQIKSAVEEEEALGVSDFILRRSDACLSPSRGLNVVDAVAQEMGDPLGWSDSERQAQVRNNRRHAAAGQVIRKGDQSVYW